MKSDEAFMDALELSYLRVVWVACEIVRRYPHCRVEAPIVVYPPRSVHRGEYTDQGDLHVITEAGRRHRYEVKGRSRYDLREFPYNTMYLGECYKMANDVVGVFVIGRTKFPMWLFKARDGWRRVKHDSFADGRVTESWECPVSLATVWENTLAN